MGTASSSESSSKEFLQKAYQDDQQDDQDDDNSIQDEFNNNITTLESSYFNDDEIVYLQQTIQVKSLSSSSSSMSTVNHGGAITIRYKIIDTLAPGATARVYKCQQLNESYGKKRREKMVIVKRMNSTMDLENSMEINQELLRECLELHTMHILRLLNCFEIGQDNSKTYFIVSEYCELGNLRNIRNQMDNVPISIVLQLIFQIVMALKFLNSRHFVHRDVKLDNIFIRNLDKVRMKAVLGDLGTVVKLSGQYMEFNHDPNSTSINNHEKDTQEETVSETDSMTGTPGYRDPVTLEKRRVYYKSDLWSFGVTLVRFIFLKNLPQMNLEESSQEEINDLINHLFIPLEERDVVWTNVKRIVMGMLQVDIETRFGIDQILLEMFVDIQKLSTESFESNYLYLKECFKQHESVIESTLSYDGLFLQYLSETQRDCLDLVLKAIDQNGEAYEYASDRLKNDGNVIVKAHIKDIRVKHLFVRKLTIEEEEKVREAHYSPVNKMADDRESTISEQERNDMTFISKLISKDGKLLEIASPNLKNNHQIVKQSLHSNGLALQFASPSLRKKKDLVELAIQQNPLSLAYADKSLRDDIELVKKALFQNGLALEFASKSIKSNKEIIKMAIHNNYKALSLISPRILSNDPEFICSLLSHSLESLDEYEKYFFDTFDIVEWVSNQFSGSNRSKLKHQSADLIVMYSILYELDRIRSDFSFIMECLKEGSKRKHPYALFKLGTIYYHGDFNTEPNYTQALKYLDESSKMGFVQAHLVLFSLYAKESEIVKIDMKKAFNYILLAANQGSALAQHNLSRMYKNGEGVPVDNGISFDWLIKSGRNGYVDSQLLLSLLYDEGNRRDVILSYEWCVLAAEQGNSFAQLFLGEKLISGDGCTRNIPLAAKWLKKAAQGEKVSAMLNLGLIYHDSPEMKNPEKAFKWFYRAAEKGNMDAQHNLGYCYFEGLGVKKDYYEAFSWFVKAHNNGHKSSFHNIMIMVVKNLVSPHDKMVSGWIVSEAVNGRKEALALLEVYNPTMFSLIKQGAYGNVTII